MSRTSSGGGRSDRPGLWVAIGGAVVVGMAVAAAVAGWVVNRE